VFTLSRNAPLRGREKYLQRLDHDVLLNRPQRRWLLIGELIQAGAVAFALQIGTPPPRRRNLHLLHLTVPMRQSD